MLKKVYDKAKYFILVILGLLVFVSLKTVVINSDSSTVQAASTIDRVTHLRTTFIPSKDIVSCDDPNARSVCGDGTCSTSTDQGTCSYHGGVVSSISPSNQTSQPSSSNQTSQPVSTPYVEPQLNDPLFKSLSEASNLVTNGDFEDAYYPVPELGFEPPDSGQIPVGWNWYKSKTYGKYNIYNNEAFGIMCPDDFRLFTDGNFSLSFHMQSTDQPDARLGVYQKVKVTPGQSYLFTVSGAIQAQPGASSPDINNLMELYFDSTGNTDWQAVPHEKWTQLPWKEQELEFKISGPDDPDLAKVQTYYTIVKPKSDQLTIFMHAWRRWANWRTTIFTVDCVMLTPLNQVDMGALLPRLSEISTTAVDAALKGAGSGSAPASAPATTPAAVPAATPAAAAQPAPVTAVEPPTVPSAGGILDTKSNALLLTLASVVVIVGLVGAGVWNARRKRE